jgi:ribosomal protein L10
MISNQYFLQIQTQTNPLFHTLTNNRNDYMRSLKDEGKPYDHLKSLTHLLVGPCIALTSASTDTENPRLLHDLLSTLSSPTASPYAKKILLVGGAFEGTVVSAEMVKEVAKLPSMARLREEVVGVLSSPAASLAGVLEVSQKMLILNLEMHAKGKDEAKSE